MKEKDRDLQDFLGGHVRPPRKDDQLTPVVTVPEDTPMFLHGVSPGPGTQQSSDVSAILPTQAELNSFLRH